MNREFTDRIIQIVGTQGLMCDEPMSNHTTFRLGGNAQYFIVPDKTEAIGEIIKACKEFDVPFTVIGRGSNLLVSDKGIKGAVICIYRTMDEVEFIEHEDKTEVVAGAGIMLGRLASMVLEHELCGFEFASGIPGTLGGAITMNAGAYGGQMSDVVTKVEYIDYEGNVETVSAEAMKLSYRHSLVMEKDIIVTKVYLEFAKGDKEAIKAKMNEFNEARRTKQPLEYPSAGSTFKRPEGYFAGKLIMDAGLAGFRVGGACVSSKHCGFVINDENATAQDVMNLMKKVDEVVFEKYQVHLEPEVRIIGEW